MRTQESQHSEQTIESVQTRFDHWRKTRRKREAIPEDLWAAAVALAETHSICHIGRRLRLNTNSLKQRINRPIPAPPQDVIKSSSFIEIPFIPTGQTAHCQVDIQRKDGSRMQIRMPQAELELTTLVRAFLG
jgi:hypothetical protein